MPDFFAKGSVIRRVSLEPALLFGAGRALLLQLAHPAVAQGVDEHSDFKRNPFTRLQGTLEATYAVVFGSEELAHGVGRRIRWIHDFVTGPGYAANDPANLLWVHATLFDTALRCHTDLVGPLAGAELDEYYDQTARVAEVFGVPRDAQPATVDEFRSYFDTTVAGLRVSDAGRDLSSFILDPTLPLQLHRPLRPVIGLQRRYTVGTVPASLREQLGLPWSHADEVRLRRGQQRVRRLFVRTPPGVRTAGTRAMVEVLVRQAGRRVAAWEATQRRRAAA